jgi:NAD(P)-dependent dehydrogenase (short-subunit alcohol dehydrogenase family)
MKPSSFDLTGKVAIISGGATGIGRAIADGLAEAGASIVICGRRFHKCEEACKEIQERTGTRALAHRCDITSKDEIETLVNTVLDECKRVDILVNSAGDTSNYHVLDLSEEEWDRVININLKGYFLCSQAVGRIMAASRGGVIINISSLLGDVARPNRVHYCSAKGGVKMLTKALALDLASYGIRVNAVAPGPVETEMVAPILADPTVKAEILANLPIGRIGQPEDIAGAVVFLASEAAAFVTGTTLYVDGGYTAK